MILSRTFLLLIYYFAFPLDVAVCSHVNCLPVYIDIWNDSIKYVAESTKNLKLFYVTSRAVYNLIKAELPGSNVRYMHLSVSDRYFSPNFEKYRRKTIRLKANILTIFQQPEAI